jgi:hypothetical protein
MEIYSYEELFEIIKIQMEKENKNKKEDESSQLEKLSSSGLRLINNPTLQNLNNITNILLNTNKETKIPEDTSKYIYKS